MKNKLKVKILKNEYWYGGNVALGCLLPFTRFSFFRLNDIRNTKYNQAAPFYLSNKGRYIWSNDGFKIKVSFDKIICTNNTSEIKLYEGFKDLKRAFLAASKKHFPPKGNMPPELMFRIPQYCTWVELIDNQNQKDVIDYARSIIENGMPPGEIIIDDGWQNDFGDWVFKKETFPDPHNMIKELQNMGFNVSLWICPFVSKDSPDFNLLVKNNALVRNKKNKLALRRWWNGRDYVLDLTNNFAVKWFMSKCQYLIDEYGIKGFKQDAGDARYYRANDITTKPTTPNTQSELWAKLASKFEYNELRACWKCAGEGYTQRLADKTHRWIHFFGLKSLIPNILTLGIIGHPYGCPDMIGGGLEIDFNKPEKKYDHELFVRSSQCSALMPMMQYSKSIWRLKRKDISKLCIEASNYHKLFENVIIDEAKKSKDSGEPILRYIEYEFPNEGFEKEKQQFMLGSKYFVAPIVKKGQKIKKIRLPKGKWKLYQTKQVYDGDSVVELKVDLETLPIFEKL